MDSFLVWLLFSWVLIVFVMEIAEHRSERKTRAAADELTRLGQELQLPDDPMERPDH